MKTSRYEIELPRNKRPIDPKDPKAAATAIALAFPHELSDNAWRMLNYLEGTAFLFAYKGKLVVTDESLDLTDGPRWVGDDFRQLEAWLEREFWGWLESGEDVPFTTESPVVRWPY